MKSELFLHFNVTASVSDKWFYATGVYSLLCLLCGSLSNGLVIFVFFRNSNLQRPRNFLLINLAVADLGLLLTNNILHTIASFNKHWPFGQRGCNWYAFCGGVCGLTSIATMAAISLTRLVAVIDPFSTLNLTSGFILKCIGCSWIYGSIWMFGPLFGWNRFVLEGFGTTCTFDYISKDVWNRLFVLVLMIGGFLIPLTIILASYTFILMKLLNRSRFLTCRKTEEHIRPLQSRQRNLPHSFPLHAPNDEQYRDKMTAITERYKDDRINPNIRRTELRATRTALLVCGAFCFAWFPYALMAVLAQFGYDHFVNVYTTALLSLFAKTAACVNPLIYALTSSTFRQHICFYTSYLFKCQPRPFPPSLSNYELNRRHPTVKYDVRLTQYEFSQL